MLIMPPIVLVCCKCDLVFGRSVPIQDVMKFSCDKSVSYVETSSKFNECFLEIVKEIDKFKNLKK
jgi:GTPase SAR1 family protein